MNNEIIVAILSLIGTIVGAFGGIIVSSKLTIYRIEQLERDIYLHSAHGASLHA